MLVCSPLLILRLLIKETNPVRLMLVSVCVRRSPTVLSLPLVAEIGSTVLNSGRKITDPCTL